MYHLLYGSFDFILHSRGAKGDINTYKSFVIVLSKVMMTPFNFLILSSSILLILLYPKAAYKSNSDESILVEILFAPNFRALAFICLMIAVWNPVVCRHDRHKQY